MVRPLIFGILNVTEDSFSDGSKYLEPDAAIAHGLKLAAGGADVIDIGAASSNPDAKPVAPEEEIRRLTPVVAALQAQGIALSVDSFALPVQRWALKRDVAWLNDIEGFAEPALYPELAASSAKLIVMHSVQGRGRATRVETDPATIMERLNAFFDARIAALTQAGIARERLALDPGMGFFLGRDPEVSLHVLKNLRALKQRYGLPVFVSLSRKSFLRAIAGREPQDAGAASLAGELYAALNGADMIRTHDPRALADALKVWASLA